MSDDEESEGRRLLHCAGDGNADEVRRILSERVGVDWRSSQGDTAGFLPLPHHHYASHAALRDKVVERHEARLRHVAERHPRPPLAFFRL